MWEKGCLLAPCVSFDLYGGGLSATEDEVEVIDTEYM